MPRDGHVSIVPVVAGRSGLLCYVWLPLYLLCG